MATWFSGMVNPFKPPGMSCHPSWCMGALQTGLQTLNSICLAYDDIDEHLLTDPSWHQLATHAAFPSHAMSCI